MAENDPMSANLQQTTNETASAGPFHSIAIVGTVVFWGYGLAVNQAPAWVIVVAVALGAMYSFYGVRPLVRMYNELEPRHRNRYVRAALMLFIFVVPGALWLLAQRLFF